MPPTSTTRVKAKQPLERRLVEDWRKAYLLTQEQLGKGFRDKRNRHRVADIENATGRMTITKILQFIEALERVTKECIVPAATNPPEGLRLAAFFLGPEGRDSGAALATAARKFTREEAGGRE